MSETITPEMPVEDIVERYPRAVEVLTRRGVICIQCGAPVWGTLAEAVALAGQDVEEVIAELNRELSG